MHIETCNIDGVKLVTPKRFGDHRGYFSETYGQAAFAAAGIADTFVQDNQSLSTNTGTIRGLHFQLQPAAQAKLVRVIRGAVFDVAVDLRRESPTFGQHFAVELSAENGRQLYVPVGFAHGFCTLMPDTEVIYKVSAPYAPAQDRGLAWDDPALGIAWPLPSGGATLSDKDTKNPRLADLQETF